jgi:putative Holliday junction resolvase
VAAVATILGVDPGTRRIGLAIADLETRFARPLEVVPASSVAIARILELAEERSVVKIVVGKPVGLSGRDGPAVVKQQSFVADLRAATEIPVEEYDERLTTVMAESALRSAGASAKSRKEIRDAVAAQVMLQGFLDASR